MYHNLASRLFVKLFWVDIMILTIQPHPANKSRGVGLFGEGMRHEGRQRSPLVWTNGDLLSDADESSAHTPSLHYTLHPSRRANHALGTILPCWYYTTRASVYREEYSWYKGWGNNCLLLLRFWLIRDRNSLSFSAFVDTIFDDLFCAVCVVNNMTLCIISTVVDFKLNNWFKSQFSVFR